MMELEKNKFLDVFHHKEITEPPIWLMRQAGRYLPEYHRLRNQKKPFLEICYTPELAAAITLQPLERFALDAAIIFSDILVIPDALGVPIHFEKGKGPCLQAIQSKQAVTSLRFSQEKLTPVYEAITMVRQSLSKKQALIGFCGAPWTLIAYMLEGQGSKHFHQARLFAYHHPATFAMLLEKVTQAVLHHALEQIRSGADAIQLFDSWAGVVPEEQFLSFVIEPTQKITAGIKNRFPHIPVIGFPRQCGAWYPTYTKMTGIDAVSVDQYTPLSWVSEQVECVIQGNMDNILLLADLPSISAEVSRIKTIMSGRKFIFNLGHGVLPETPVEHVEFLISCLKTH